MLVTPTSCASSPTVRWAADPGPLVGAERSPYNGRARQGDLSGSLGFVIPTTQADRCWARVPFTHPLSARRVLHHGPRPVFG
jgi:hypothetical protein